MVIRPSSLPKYIDCPRRQAANSFPELIEAAGYNLRTKSQHIGAIVGTSVHKGGSYINQANADGSEISLSEVQDAAVGELESQIDQYEVGWDNETNNKSTAARQVARMVRQYMKDAAGFGRVVSVERRLQGKMPGLNVTLSGQTDAVTVMPGALRDLKTGKTQGWNIAQYGAYRPLLRAHGFTIDQIVEDFLPRVSLTKDQPPVRSVQLDPVLCESVAKRVITQVSDDVQRFTKTGDRWEFQSNPQSSLCKARFCSAFNTSFCKEHKPEDF